MYSQGTMCKMIAKCTQEGQSIDAAIDYAQSELEGFLADIGGPAPRVCCKSVLTAQRLRANVREALRAETEEHNRRGINERTLLTRRTVLQTAALATTALTAPFVHGAYAAGKLSFGVWDHWVPGASEELKKICREWAEKEKVDLNVDLITSNGDKDLLTLMAEGQAKAGHDIMGLRTWYVSAQAENFVPVDDIVEPRDQGVRPDRQACRIFRQDRGPLDGGADQLWQRLAAALRPHRLCQGICRARRAKDVPGRCAARQGADRDWDWNNFLTAAEKCFKAGHPFGIGLSTCTDAINMAGAVFHSYGADLVDAEGNITVKTDATRQALEFFKQLCQDHPTSVLRL